MAKAKVTTEVISIPLPDITAEKYPTLYATNGLRELFNNVREKVIHEVVDVTTESGRSRIKALASAVSSSKVAVETPGRDYLRKLKEAVKPAESELKWFVDSMNKLRDEVRLPVTEYENTEKERIQKLNARLNILRQSVDVIDEFGTLLSSAIISQRLDTVTTTKIDASWQELRTEAEAAKDAATAKLQQSLAIAIERETQAAETERIRKENEELQRQQREEKIRQDAAETARIAAEKEAERKLQEQRNAAAVEISKAKAQQEEIERREREAKEQAERDKEAAIALAVAAEKKKEADRIERENAEREAQEQREKDKEHRQKIYSRFMDDLVANTSLTRVQAREVVVAISANKCPDAKLIF
ncbi:hypothetical protein BV923_09645 [Pectobacterium odoriferum]|uniref:hypothetical protein n=1 Tax=Pectobacterium odoriferum TaxID=78398 RepID=UPI000CD21E6A|nr:hypothetical protein [Pectobacterium odoriferum]POE22839.1 hypothetical protein BV923_09645 [Pectobacterium odoriferum]